MMPIGDERGTIEPITRTEPDPRCDFVTAEADSSCDGERSEVVEMLGMDQPEDRLDRGNRRGNENREDDRIPGPSFTAFTTRQKGDRERDRRERVAAIVAQVREQCD